MLGSTVRKWWLGVAALKDPISAFSENRLESAVPVLRVLLPYPFFPLLEFWSLGVKLISPVLVVDDFSLVLLRKLALGSNSLRLKVAGGWLLKFFDVAVPLLEELVSSVNHILIFKYLVIFTNIGLRGEVYALFLVELASQFFLPLSLVLPFSV